jgi:hypothetical protein
VAKRNTGRRGRPRKRRGGAHETGVVQRSHATPSPTDAVEQHAGVTPGAGAAASRSPSTPSRPAKRGASRTVGRLSELQTMGERPPAPWDPLPLSELLIFVGAIGVVVGLVRRVTVEGPGQLGGPGAAVLVAGIAAVVIGTIEVTLREHRSGYRSHTLLLSLLPAIVLYTVVVLAVSAFATVPHWLNIPLLLIAAALFAVLFKVLRATFTDARRERTFAARR